MANNNLNSLAQGFAVPMIRLLHEAGTSTFYNYLPMEKSDKESIAWLYYYRQLEEMKQFLTDHEFSSELIRKNCMSLLEDVRRMITSCEGAAAFPKYWFDANPALKTCATDLGCDDVTTADEMVQAFINLFVLADPTAGHEILSDDPIAAFTEDRPLTPEEKEQLKTELSNFRNDAAVIYEEIRLRKQLLKEYLGTASQAPLSDEAVLQRKNIEKATGYTVYHVIEEKDRIVFLCITDEIPYWANQRPSASRFGVYAFGYEMYRDSALKGGYGQILLRNDRT